MEQLDIKAVVIIESNFSLSDIDNELLFLAYQPIVSAKAISLYLTALKFQKVFLIREETTVEELLSILGMSLREFIEAREKLEAISLLQTHYKETENRKYYLLDFFPPVSPQNFFSNVLFTGLLNQNISIRTNVSLKAHFLKKVYDREGFFNLSATYKATFNPNLDSNSFLSHQDPNGLLNTKTLAIEREFNVEILKSDLLSNHQISYDDLSEEEKAEIIRISLLYGIEESSVGDLVERAYIRDSEGAYLDSSHFLSVAILSSKINFSRSVKELKRSPDFLKTADTMLTKKLRMFEQKSPREYLELLQGNSKVSKADLIFINELSRDYQLSPSLINVVVDYTLQRCEQSLNYNYARKVVETLKRVSPDSTYDAMNYLYYKYERVKTNRKKDEKEKKPIQSAEVEISANEDARFNQLIGALEDEE